MRTTLDIDESLLEEARELTGTKTKTETVELGLQELIKAGKRQKLQELRGSGFGMSQGDLSELRRDK